MKQFLLFTLAVLFSGFATAQTIEQQETTAQKTATKAPAVELMRVTTGSRSVADTIFPAALDLDCASPPSLFFSDTSGTLGYVFGSNQYNDFEKLQRVTLPEAVDFSVEEVVVAFAVADAGIVDRRIVVKLYTDLEADGAFGTLAGVSDTLVISDLALNDSLLVYTSFPFSTPAQFTDADAFLISVDVSDVYFNAAGDYEPAGNVGIYSTNSDCGDGNNVYEIFPTQEGTLAFNTIYNNWNMINLEMYVGAIIERAPYTSVTNPNTDFAAIAAPNPASNELTITFDAPEAGEYNVRVLSTSGAVISQQKAFFVAGAARSTVVVDQLPTGLYLFQVESARGVQTGRFVKQ